MKTQLIFRMVDARNKKGMYYSKTTKRLSLWTRTYGFYVEDWTRHPHPYEDGISESVERDHRFGFNSVSQMRRWVCDHEMDVGLENFEEMEGVVKVYKIVRPRKVYNGSRQVMFDKRAVKLVACVPPGEFERNPSLLAQLEEEAQKC
tara:strand:+ start:139 stop:579 length:441 start_codon:yes stop_codon:yes gene_type:complete